MNGNLEECLRTLRPAAPSAQLDRRVAATIQAAAHRRPIWSWSVPLWACGAACALFLVAGLLTGPRPQATGPHVICIVQPTESFRQRFCRELAPSALPFFARPVTVTGEINPETKESI